MKTIINISRLVFIVLSFFLIHTIDVSAQKENKIYIIEQGDTVYSIANRYGVSLEEIYELNPWARNPLRVGSKLLLPDDAKYQPLKMKTYIIQSGDTMYSVCKRYGISEEQLMAANTGISASMFPAGRGINIPPKDFMSNSHNIAKPVTGTDDTNFSVPLSNALKITLALPFMKGQKYIEFYKGFLMGLNEARQKGISVDLNVVDLSASDAMKIAKANNSFINRDMVIGGISQEDIANISLSINKGYYIVPFNGADDISELSSRIIQINSPDANTQSDAASVFLRNYVDKNIYFVSRYTDNESLFAKRVKVALTNEGKSYYTIDLDNTSTLDIKPNSVIIPIDKSQDLLLSLLDRLPQKSDFNIFGYPLWQSFPSDIINRLHYYNTTIFSTFYFDNRDTDAIIFLNKFRAWYRQPVTNSYPKFSVMGYDMARYFINAYIDNDGILSGVREKEYNGLQMDFTLSPSQQGLQNKNLYFVTYSDDGMVERTKVM